MGANARHFPTCPINKLQQQYVGSTRQTTPTDTVRGFVKAKTLTTSTDAAPVPYSSSKPKSGVKQLSRTYKNKRAPSAKEFQWTAYHRGSEAELRETAQKTLRNQQNQRYQQKLQQPVPVFPETQPTNEWKSEEDWEDDLTFTLHKCSLGVQTDGDMNQSVQRKRSLSTQTEHNPSSTTRPVISPIHFPGQEPAEAPAKRRIVLSSTTSAFQPVKPTATQQITQSDAIVWKLQPEQEEVHQRPTSPDQSDHSTTTKETPPAGPQASGSTHNDKDITGSCWDVLPQSSVSNLFRHKEHYEMLVSRIATLERELALARKEQQAVIFSVLQEFDTQVGRSEQPDMSV